MNISERACKSNMDWCAPDSVRSAGGGRGADSCAPCDRTDRSNHISRWMWRVILSCDKCLNTLTICASVVRVMKTDRRHKPVANKVYEWNDTMRDNKGALKNFKESNVSCQLRWGTIAQGGGAHNNKSSEGDALSRPRQRSNCCLVDSSFRRIMRI